LTVERKNVRLQIFYLTDVAFRHIVVLLATDMSRRAGGSKSKSEAGKFPRAGGDGSSPLQGVRSPAQCRASAFPPTDSCRCPFGCIGRFGESLAQEDIVRSHRLPDIPAKWM
jgi:hypothetical protein